MVVNFSEANGERQQHQHNQICDFIGAYKKYIQFDFGPSNVFSERDFEPRNQMPRCFIQRYFTTLNEKGEFPYQRGAARKLGIHPFVRRMPVLRNFASKKEYEEVVKLREISALEAHKALLVFVKCKLKLFGGRVRKMSCKARPP